MNKIPLLSPAPADPPFSKLDSAAILHIGHCAITSGLMNSKQTIKRHMNLTRYFVIGSMVSIVNIQ